MFSKVVSTLLVVLGMIGIGAMGTLVAHWPDNAAGLAWPVGIVLAALSIMVVCGLTFTRES